MYPAEAILFSNAAAHVSASPALARLTWHPGPRRMPDLQAAMHALLRALRALHTGKVLVDQQLMAPLAESEVTWLLTRWLPRAVAQGRYRYAGVILPTDARARAASVRAWSAIPVDSPQYAVFDNEVAARQWLHQQVVITSSTGTAGDLAPLPKAR